MWSLIWSPKKTTQCLIGRGWYAFAKDYNISSIDFVHFWRNEETNTFRVSINRIDWVSCNYIFSCWNFVFWLISVSPTVATHCLLFFFVGVFCEKTRTIAPVMWMSALWLVLCFFDRNITTITLCMRFCFYGSLLAYSGQCYFFSHYNWYIR